MATQEIPAGVPGVYQKGRGYFGKRHRNGRKVTTPTLPTIAAVLEMLDEKLAEVDRRMSSPQREEQHKMNRAAYDAWLNDRRRRGIPAEGLREA